MKHNPTVTKKFEKIKTLIANGEGVAASCEKVGLSMKTYYSRIAAEKGSVVLHDVTGKTKRTYNKKPKTTGNIGKLALVIGTPEQIRAMIGSV